MTSTQQHQAHSYAAHPPPANHYEVRLPPIRELGVVYRDEHAPSSQQPQQDYSPAQGHPSRHDPQSWSRSSSGPGPAPSQRGMPPPSEPPKSQYSSKPDVQYATPGIPLSAQGNGGSSGPNSRPGSGRGDPSSQPGLKRPRSNSSVNEAPGRSPHTAYPPHTTYSSHPPPHGSFHQPPPNPAPSQEPPHPPPVFAQPGSSYPPYVPPQHQQHHMTQRHYQVPPPPAHPQQPSSAYPPPAPAEHWQQQPSPAPPPHYQSPAPQGPYNNFPRTTPLVPETVDSRSGPPAHDPKGSTHRQKAITEIVEHCNVLYSFASRCASHPHIPPSPEELQDMSKRAALVVRLMEDLCRHSLPEDQLPKGLPLPNGAGDEHRPPKRPWEDTVDENEPPNVGGRGEYGDDKSTAEQDMEIIRSKRATSAGGNAPGQPKSKYRKRSRATPPGKCHSCNIRETPEWRRGPDGARTLCNACGLHYAKLMRKRDKNGLGPDGKSPITIESLRASTASARGNDQPAENPVQQQQVPPQQSGLVQTTYDQHAQRSGPSPPHMTSQYPSPHPAPKSGPPPPQHMQHSSHPQHPGSYQLMPVQGGHHPMMPPPPSHAEAGVPPPPWMASSASSSGGRPAYGAEHQTYMRASHPPSHARASPQ
ncbi:hypothetical protein BXZ70DRAFT_1007942 [Cristinia sonorae]|uniref:GATA-type domain-containing protein n=1 Tax=Cristinia sonorae TaxID=1940300 RepID=A0A8K0UQ81_9AGAR|nr:hypothetical protein BXZ70DRAFT_1007942 [Cristinia sonorae]